MASELEDLGRRLRAGGYAEGGTLVTTLARSLRGLRLVPSRLPENGADRLTLYQNRKVLLDVRRLRELRQVRYLSQRGLALAARLSPSYVSNVEAHPETVRVRWSTVLALAAALETAPEDLTVSEAAAP